MSSEFIPLIVVVVCIILPILLIWFFALRPLYSFLSTFVSENFASVCIKFLVYFTVGIFLSWAYALFADEIYYLIFRESFPWQSVDLKFIESLGAITLGYLGIISIPWQLNILYTDVTKWNENGLPKRLIFSVFICVIIFSGVIVAGLFKMQDSSRIYEFTNLIGDLGKTAIFSIFFLAKSYISVIISTSSIGLIIYRLSHDSYSFNLQDSLSPIVSWALHFAPDFIHNFYAICSSVYFLCVSGMEGIVSGD